ncbi:MAG: ABC-F family ATP-binding cassette domain-containing protein [Planctomycetes bacterium]|nr:ABC-F family ATP-binding cassette domain-containing protein [Planctomycetota bacterium]
MSLLTLTDAHCAYGSQVVLGGVTVSIEPGQKIGLVGRNGSGKTTLMRIMLGEIAADSGSRQLKRGARVGYLRQEPSFDPRETVFDAAEAAFAEVHRMHRKLLAVYEKMAEPSAQGTGADLQRLLAQQAALQGRLEQAGGYAINHRIEASLNGLGFSDEQFDLPTGALSGGQLARLALARLLLEAPDLLLLDEPTNHLDLDGRRWLEELLAREYQNAVVVVSHDRWLLDSVVSRIIEIDGGTLRSYPGNYSAFVEIRRQHRVTVARTYQKQLDTIRREEEFIQRYKAGQRARQARGRQRRLERFRARELIEPPRDLDVMKLTLPRAQRSGEKVIEAEGLSKRYGDTVLFEDVDLALSRGDRLGIIGPNGVGKTTLVNCLLGEVPSDSGSVRLGSKLRLGYYRQQFVDLDLTLLVWQYLQRVIVSLDVRAQVPEQQARDLAGAFLFSGERQDKRLGELSGGELSRVRLAGLVAGAHNLLVLDEPTNHLDIPSSERLEQALCKQGGYAGTLMLVTHDRALLEALCDELVIFDGRGGVRRFCGTYSQWMQHNRTASRPGAVAQTAEGAPRKTDSRKTGRRRAPKQPARGELERLSLEAIEERIETLQQLISEIDDEFLDPAVGADRSRSKTLQARRADLVEQLGPPEAEWARRASAES